MAYTQLGSADGAAYDGIIAAWNPVSREDWTIRKFRPLDAKAGAEFARRLEWLDVRMRWGALTVSPEYLMPRAPGGVAFAAWNTEGQIVGVLNLEHLNAHSMEMAAIVRSDQKRRGIGRTLLEHAIRWAEENRLAQIVCYIDPENVAALTLTQAAGCRSIGRDDFFITMRRMIR